MAAFYIERQKETQRRNTQRAGKQDIDLSLGFVLYLIWLIMWREVLNTCNKTLKRNERYRTVSAKSSLFLIV